jgi:hypothetical protein
MDTREYENSVVPVAYIRIVLDEEQISFGLIVPAMYKQIR